MKESDVIVIGGGIIGTSVAFFLGKKGLKTTLIEKEFIASGASSLSAGTFWCPSNDILYNNQTDRLCTGTVQIMKNISKFNDFEFVQNGSLYVAFNYFNSFMLFRTYLMDKYIYDHNVEFLNSKEMLSIEPKLNKNIICGLHYSLSGSVNPSEFTHSMADSAIDTGNVVIHENTKIIGVNKTNNMYSIKTNKGDFHSKNIVLATGVWANNVSKYFNINIPVVPVKGQIWLCDNPKINNVIFNFKSNSFWKNENYKLGLTHDENGNEMSHHYYGKPTKDNKFMFGGLRKLTDINDYDIDKKYLQKNIEKFNDIYCKTNYEGCWTGLMPFSVTGKILLGEFHPGLWVANGFGPSGIMKGPMACKELAEKIYNKIIN